MKTFLYASLAVAALSVAACLWWLAVRLDSHVAATRQDLSDSADMLDARMEAESARYASLLSAQSAAWRDTADRQASEYRRTLERESAALRGQLVYAQVMEVRPVRDAAVSALDGHAKLAKELTTQSQDLYWDVKAGVESSTVAARGVAEAAESTGKAMPRIASSAEIVASEAAKAAPDARAVVSNVKAITKPPGILMKVVGFFGKLLF